MLVNKVLSSSGPVPSIAWGLIDQTVDLANRLFTHIPLVESVRIADRLSAVTDIGTESPAAPLGLADDCAHRIWQAVEGLYRSRLHNQIALCVRRDGEVILNRSIGIAQGEYGDLNAVAGSVDTPFCIFSASKVVASLLLCKLEELNELSLSDTVSRYIPEFARHGKEDITLGELISHRGKVPSMRLEDPLQMVDHDYIVDHLCDTEPHGARQAYHAMTGGFIIAEVIERVTGDPITEALDTFFRKPLKMKYFTFGLAKRYRNKFAKSHASGFPLTGPLSTIPMHVLGMTVEDVVELSNIDLFCDAVLPSGNLFATAEECSRFYQMLLDEGEYNGQQVMHPETVRKARGGDFFPYWDATFNIPAHFSRGGFMLNAFPTWLYGLDAPRAFGHLGFINILTWADPQRNITVGLMSSGKPFAGPHLYNFANIPNTINRHCPGKRRTRGR